jgi:hypothetical protein
MTNELYEQLLVGIKCKKKATAGINKQIKQLKLFIFHDKLAQWKPGMYRHKHKKKHTHTYIHTVLLLIIRYFVI